MYSVFNKCIVLYETVQQWVTVAYEQHFHCNAGLSKHFCTAHHHSQITTDLMKINLTQNLHVYNLKPFGGTHFSATLEGLYISVFIIAM